MNEATSNSGQPSLDVSAEHTRIELLSQAQNAARRLDMDACKRIVNLALAETTGPDIVPALCALLKRPRGFWKQRVWLRAPGVELRISAIEALRRYNSPESANALANTLLQDVPQVREHASSALVALGSAAAAPLLTRIQRAKDWPLDGMLCTINTLSQIGDPSAIRGLPSILPGSYPLVPARWTRWLVNRGVCWWIVMTLLMSVVYLNEPFAYLWELLIMSIVGGGMLSGLPCGILVLMAGRRQRNEYSQIYAAVVDAITRLNEPEAIPGLLWVVSSAHIAGAVKEALRGLKLLLPLISVQNRELLNHEQERRLTDLLSSSDSDLVLAVLRALEFVGTGQSARRVERLAGNLGVSRNWPVLKQAQAEAERILPILRQQRRAEEAEWLLLRSSEAPSARVNELLRPADANAVVEPPSELLRAAADDRTT